MLTLTNTPRLTVIPAVAKVTDLPKAVMLSALYFRSRVFGQFLGARFVVVMTVEDFREAIGYEMSDPTVRNHLKGLVQQGLLEEHGAMLNRGIAYEVKYDRLKELSGVDILPPYQPEPGKAVAPTFPLITTGLRPYHHSMSDRADVTHHCQWMNGKLYLQKGTGLLRMLTRMDPEKVEDHGHKEPSQPLKEEQSSGSKAVEKTTSSLAPLQKQKTLGGTEAEKAVAVPVKVLPKPTAAPSVVKKPVPVPVPSPVKKGPPAPVHNAPTLIKSKPVLTTPPTGTEPMKVPATAKTAAEVKQFLASNKAAPGVNSKGEVTPNSLEHLFRQEMVKAGLAENVGLASNAADLAHAKRIITHCTKVKVDAPALVCKIVADWQQFQRACLEEEGKAAGSMPNLAKLWTCIAVAVRFYQRHAVAAAPKPVVPSQAVNKAKAALQKLNGGKPV